MSSCFSPHIAPVTRPWLVQLRLDLSFPQPIATAMDFSPARRPAVPVQRHHPGSGCNMRAELIPLPG
jgi:hypothetical protein